MNVVLLGVLGYVAAQFAIGVGRILGAYLYPLPCPSLASLVAALAAYLGVGLATARLGWAAAHSLT